MDKAVEEEGKLFWMSMLFVGIIIGLPLLIELMQWFFKSLAGPQGYAWFMTNLWLGDVATYLPIYVFMLFYLKTTFNPLSVYGYVWKKDYFWWAVYLGIGSGVVMYLVDKFNGGYPVQTFSIGVFLGYLAGFVLLPALTEETLFRGVIQRYFQKHTKTFTQWNISKAVLIASGFELLFHLVVPVYFGASTTGIGAAALHTLPQLVYVLIFGIIGGVLYQRTGSLVAPITIHALGNLTELILLWMLH